MVYRVVFLTISAAVLCMFCIRIHAFKPFSSTTRGFFYVTGNNLTNFILGQLNPELAF